MLTTRCPAFRTPRVTAAEGKPPASALPGSLAAAVPSRPHQADALPEVCLAAGSTSHLDLSAAIGLVAHLLTAVLSQQCLPVLSSAGLWVFSSMCRRPAYLTLGRVLLAAAVGPVAGWAGHFVALGLVDFCVGITQLDGDVALQLVLEAHRHDTRDGFDHSRLSMSHMANGACSHSLLLCAVAQFQQ